MWVNVTTYVVYYTTNVNSSRFPILFKQDSLILDSNLYNLIFLKVLTFLNFRLNIIIKCDVPMVARAPAGLAGGDSDSGNLGSVMSWDGLIRCTLALGGADASDSYTPSLHLATNDMSWRYGSLYKNRQFHLCKIYKIGVSITLIHYQVARQ